MFEIVSCDLKNLGKKWEEDNEAEMVSVDCTSVMAIIQVFGLGHY